MNQVELTGTANITGLLIIVVVVFFAAAAAAAATVGVGVGAGAEGEDDGDLIAEFEPIEIFPLARIWICISLCW